MSASISVIIPTYNRRPQLLEAIESVQAQTHQAAEIIVVDDGSTDGTPDALTDHPGIRYLRQRHSGPAVARSRGLEAAGGEFIASLDSDDLWEPTFLERSLTAITAHDRDFVFSNWSQDGGRPSYLSRWEASGRLSHYRTERRDDWWLLGPRQLRHLFLDACLAPSSSLLMRRSAMPPGWNSTMRIADDWYLLLEMVLPSPRRAAFTLTPLWHKRTDGTNRYDGLPPHQVAAQLYVHDYGYFRRDFRSFLSPRERRRQALRQTGYPVVLDSAGRVLEQLPWGVEIRIRRLLGR